jgi:Phage integrase, N-terminal SAM-like domain
MSKMLATPVKETRDKRESGSGCLIPTRPGITAFWTAQVYDKNGKLVRRSTKVRGELGPGADPKKIDSWSNVTKARSLKHFLKILKQELSRSVPIHRSFDTGALRELYLNDYKEQKHKSLMHNSETGEAYVRGLIIWILFLVMMIRLKASLKKVPRITADRIRDFKSERQAAKAANSTINRSLSALTRMFTLAVEDGKLQSAPVIKSLPEAKQPRQGFLGVAEYQKLYEALGVTVKNSATGIVSTAYVYV